MTNDQLLDSLKKKLIDNSLGLTAGIISISAISYVLSRVFIKLYLEMINYNTLGYVALSNTDTSSLFFFGILMVLLALVLLTTLVPACLRQIYLGFDTPFAKVHTNKIVDCLIIAAFISVFVISIIYIYYIQNAWIINSIAILPIAAFVYKYKNTKIITIHETPIVKQKRLYLNTTKKLNKLKFHKELNKKHYLKNSIFQGCLFALTMTLLIAPCILLIVFINQSKFIKEVHSSDLPVILASLFIWIIYSFLYGSRITKPSAKHYLYDILFSLALVYFLAIINLSTFIISIAQFVDIKDKTSNLYKISNQNYSEISEDLDLFWKNNYRNLKSAKLCQPLTKTINDYTFLQAQVIFRDSDIAILCPPDINIKDASTEECLIIDRKKMISTSKTMENLLHK